MNETLSVKNTSLFPNQGLPQAFFYDYKFKRKRHYAKKIAALIIREYQTLLRQYDVLVPVTLHRKELFRREFCPVLRITKIIAKRYSQQVVIAVKRKPKKHNTKAQHQKTISERQQIYASLRLILKKEPLIRDKRVLLIDDIMTSGTTLNAYADLMKSMQPASLSAITVLRTLRLTPHELRQRKHKIQP